MAKNSVFTPVSQFAQRIDALALAARPLADDIAEAGAITGLESRGLIVLDKSELVQYVDSLRSEAIAIARTEQELRPVSFPDFNRGSKSKAK